MVDQTEYLSKLEDVLEEQLSQVIAVFQNLPAEKLLQPSSSGGWSMAQCFEHLNSYAAYYHPKLWREINKLVVSQGSIDFRNTWIGLYFIRMMKTDATRTKYKAMKKHKPFEVSDPHAVLSLFIQYQEELLKLLQASKNKNMVKGKIGTSMSGLIKLNIGDTLEFLLVHNQRHIQQALRNL